MARGRPRPSDGKSPRAPRRRARPRIDDLEVFCAVAAELADRVGPVTLGQVAKCERRPLPIEPSQLSLRLRRLEKSVGSVLVDRQPGGREVKLTSNGQALRGRAVELLRQLDGLGSAPAAHRQELRLGATNFMATTLLPRALARFLLREDRAGLRLTCIEDEYELLEGRLHKGGGDLEFVIGPVPATIPDWMTVEPIGRSLETVLLLPPGQAQRLPEEDFQKEFGKSDWLKSISPRVLHQLQPHQSPGLDIAGVPPDVATVRHSSFAAICEAVAAGGGAGLVVGLYDRLDDLRLHGKLDYRTLKGMRNSHLGIYRNRDYPPSAVAEELINDLHETAAGLATRDAAHESRAGQQTLPTKLGPYSYGYYVSSLSEADPAPVWRKCRFFWETNLKNGEEINEGAPHHRDGHAVDLSGSLSIACWKKYWIEATLTERVLLLMAMQCFDGDSEDVKTEGYVAAIFSVLDRDATMLGGAWSGLDDQNEPTSGFMILSNRYLTLDDLQTAARLPARRALHSAGRLDGSVGGETQVAREDFSFPKKPS